MYTIKVTEMKDEDGSGWEKILIHEEFEDLNVPVLKDYLADQKDKDGETHCEEELQE